MSVTRFEPSQETTEVTVGRGLISQPQHEPDPACFRPALFQLEHCRDAPPPVRSFAPGANEKFTFPRLQQVPPLSTTERLFFHGTNCFPSWEKHKRSLRGPETRSSPRLLGFRPSP